MMARVSREMVASILGQEWEATLNVSSPSDKQSSEMNSVDKTNVDSGWESRNNNN